MLVKYKETMRLNFQVFFVAYFSNRILMFPSQCFGQFDFLSKSHVSLGTRNLYFIAIVTIPIPNKPPKIEGNSGPK